MNRELCKKLKFHHNNKRYVHKLKAVFENETHKILWDFDIQTDHPILAKKAGLVLIHKEKRSCHQVDFIMLVDQRMNVKESKNLDK